tara:strand:- start:1484 stop:1723 length:240 start_codon:yes stop_codon:yes gene_type:complete
MVQVQANNRFNSDPERAKGPSSFFNLLMRRMTMRGFIILDFMDHFPEVAPTMPGWLIEGRIKFETDIMQGLDNVPAALA